PENKSCKRACSNLGLVSRTIKSYPSETLMSQEVENAGLPSSESSPGTRKGLRSFLEDEPSTIYDGSIDFSQALDRLMPRHADLSDRHFPSLEDLVRAEGSADAIAAAAEGYRQFICLHGRQELRR